MPELGVRALGGTVLDNSARASSSRADCPVCCQILPYLDPRCCLAEPKEITRAYFFFLFLCMRVLQRTQSARILCAIFIMRVVDFRTVAAWASPAQITAISVLFTAGRVRVAY